MSRDVKADREAPVAGLYEQDFYSWTQQQARLLRSGGLQALDVARFSRWRIVNAPQFSLRSTAIIRPRAIRPPSVRASVRATTTEADAGAPASGAVAMPASRRALRT